MYNHIRVESTPPRVYADNHSVIEETRGKNPYQYFSKNIKEINKKSNVY